ncbi:hypothetical protein [Calycomorphotria hydatis]|uniref:Uncharacterized protein n=1 Tax=Calycomorphotria hydatis TaxID=2528027 RepID=A0A517T9G1_9PLAN|nr:hypothetical protein [Calycomorphotria hydatis]QDT65014.1 hypothetical protein V22_22600 [Calycomorphotria hydatis]
MSTVMDWPETQPRIPASELGADASAPALPASVLLPTIDNRCEEMLQTLNALFDHYDASQDNSLEQ